jgi:hypothetical protein
VVLECTNNGILGMICVQLGYSLFKNVTFCSFGVFFFYISRSKNLTMYKHVSLLPENVFIMRAHLENDSIPQ